MSNLLSIENKISKKVMRHFFPSSYQKHFFEIMYNRGAIAAKEADAPFMNYGYYPLEESEKRMFSDLPRQKYISSQHSLQMYHFLFNHLAAKDKAVLEVGCGRGGGCFYCKEYLQAGYVAGIDYSLENIKICCNNYLEFAIDFRKGDAEKMVIGNNTFDVVVNVESSHCYPKIERFFKEVYRVLKNDGYFLYADFRNKQDVEKWREQIEGSGLKILSSKDITPNVVESLRLRSPDREAFVRKYWIHNEEEFAGVAESTRIVGSQSFERFENREEVYMSFLIAKSEKY